MLQTKEKLGNEVAALAVICPLVLEPLSVALHTVDLLAIVVGHWVCDRVGRGVHAESSDSVEEFLLFLRGRKGKLELLLIETTLRISSLLSQRTA